MNLPSYTKEVLRVLTSNGFEAFVVGGCVRDYLLGMEAHDFDVCTNAVPDEIINCFNGYKVLEIGKRFGTITVIIDHKPTEITTYRADGKYENNRKPLEVSFSKSLSEDLIRRDFTVNAMAYNMDCGLVDINGGRADLENKIIRCVGDANERFNEDALRVLRALRFAARLDFEIEKDTRLAIFKNKQLIKSLSPERINTEFSGILSAQFCEKILTEFFDVLAVFIPDLKNLTPMLLERQYAYIHAISLSGAPLSVRLALFFDCFTVEQTESIMKNLRYSNLSIKEVCDIKENAYEAIDTKTNIKLIMSRIGLEHTLRVIDFQRALWLSGIIEKHDSAHIAEMLDEIRRNDECFTLSGLDIDGCDIKKLGFSGSKIKEILDELIKNIIEERLANEKQTLIDYINKKYR